jgi:hypothetical protein
VVEEVGSEDSHGRAVWGLGQAVALPNRRISARRPSGIEKALPALTDFDSPRAWAFALVGIHAYLSKFSGDSEVRRIREKLANKLLRRFHDHAADDCPGSRTR